MKFNAKSVLLLLVAIPVVMVASRYLGRSAGEMMNGTTAPAPLPTPDPQIQVIVSSQDAEGVTQKDFSLEFLKNFEAYTIQRVKAKSAELQGQPNARVESGRKRIG